MPMTNPIDPAQVTELLARLVATNSVNPAFDPDAPGEHAISALVEGELRDAGFTTELVDAEPGRTSVIGRRGPRGGRSLLLYAHLDTVGLGGMPGGLAPRVEGGRLYGRGAYDMKCGMAAILAAVRSLDGASLRGEVIVAGVADEEVASIGMQAVLERVTATAAIVTEPTGLDVVTAHKGFCWIDVSARGRAAHGSRFDEGIDANRALARVLARLDELEAELRRRPEHPLLGPPSLHVGLIDGGAGESIYAAQARATIERRMLPDETEASVLAELDTLVRSVEAVHPGARFETRARLTRAAYETSARSEIRQVVAEAAHDVLGAAPAERGVAYWMDAALLGAAGVDTVAFGATGGGAHSDVEWVELDSVVVLAEVLRRAAQLYLA